MKETARARQAWADYLALADRSLEKLLDTYQKRSGAPTNQLTTLKRWSVTFGWQQRLAAIAQRDALQTEHAVGEYRRSILEEGFALHYERVLALKRLATKLDATLIGADFLTVSALRLQTLLSEFRGTLDDIAKEKGERKDVKPPLGDRDNPLHVAGAVSHNFDYDALNQLAADFFNLAHRDARSAGSDGSPESLDSPPADDKAGVLPLSDA